MVPKEQQKRDPRGIGRKGGFKSLGSHLPQNAYKGKGILLKSEADGKLRKYGRD